MDPEEIKRLMLEKRNAMEAILKVAEADNKRDLNDDEDKRYNDLDAEYDQLEKRLERAEKLQRRTQSQATVKRRYQPPADHETQADFSEGEQRDLNNFSLSRSIRSLLDGERLTGLEAEVHQQGQLEQRAAGISNGGNLVLPQMILTRGHTGTPEQRDMTATGGTSGSEGGAMIQTEVGSIIDALRANLALRAAGVEFMTGLNGNLTWPKFVEDDQAAEKSENAEANESNPTLTTINSSPKRLPVFIEFSRQLVLQTSPDIERYLRTYLGQQIATRMDEMGINGSGTGEEPLGLLQTPGIGAVIGGTNGAAPTYEHIVDLESAVASVNADRGRLGYLTNTKVRGALKKTFVDASSNAERVWDKNSAATPLNEYAATISNLVPSDLDKGSSTDVCSAIIFGNFADAMLNQWGGLEFLVNPYSRDTEGLVRLNAWTFYDFLVRRAQSFSAMTDALTA